ncbi:ferredoxin [Cerasibacillus terrae]|uniref:Ferredoxin n=1 Tax=Cerasibacillus terrae TaxID=2498845 RepID=A0A5C8P2R6_9BACI|nr:ferredoxin [Cerasibacillus terrae]TXL67881.1 ferredoxin [Cerasibacillus terrae]
MRIYTMVDKETCIACGVCGAACPDVFDYDEEGISQSILDNNSGDMLVPTSFIDDVLDAYDACPSESIKVSKQPFHSNPNISEPSK